MNRLRKRILVVDDEPEVTRSIRRVLELAGEYTVKEENRPRHALVAAMEFLPDLVLLDERMPEVQGGEVATEFRSIPRFRPTPIVFLTALVTKEEVSAHGGFIGGERFLAKPVDAAELVACLRAELESPSAPMPLATGQGSTPGRSPGSSSQEDPGPRFSY